MADAAPTALTERISNLDTLRGVAVLGILVMNAVSFGLPQAAYFNLDAAGSNNWLDWVVGIAGEIFIDQKTMALFSALFGAGIVLFADNAAAKGRRANWLSLWRNLLLGVIGVLHTLVWDGDVPTALGYLALITLWNMRATTRLHELVRAAGRMALTNYLTQTLLGLLVLRVILDQGTMGRAAIFAFVICVWILQLAWSKPWLERFRFGPFEWLWRCATYRSWQPLRRSL